MQNPRRNSGSGADGIDTAHAAHARTCRYDLALPRGGLLFAHAQIFPEEILAHAREVWRPGNKLT